MEECGTEVEKSGRGRQTAWVVSGVRVCLSACLPACLSVYLSIFLSVCPQVWDYLIC